MRKCISLDFENQYIIIGRNPTGLQLYSDEIFALDSESNEKNNKILFEEVIFLMVFAIILFLVG